MVNIKARRRLGDLYKKGVEVRFGPGPDGEPVGRVAPMGKDARVGYFLDGEGSPLPLGHGEIQMWVQVPSPLQREQAMRDAQAARARSLIRAKRNEDSEEHLTIMAFLADMSEDTLADYVLQADTDTRRNDAIREVLGEKEWEDMTSIQDALRQFEEMPPEELEENEEYQAILELDSKFGQQVIDVEKQLSEVALDALKLQNRATLERKALEKRSDLVGSQAFMAEYERQMLFYSVRDFDNTGSLFFESARELAEQDDGLLGTLKEAMLPFIADQAEAKNSQGAESGSESSEPPSEPETSEASTPVTVSA